jgi:hypothetical protein
LFDCLIKEYAMKRTFRLLAIIAILATGLSFIPAKDSAGSAPVPPIPEPDERVFLPMAWSRGAVTYAVSGQIKDQQGSPVQSVIVTDRTGKSAASDAQGNYTISGLAAGDHALAASRSGFYFTPSQVNADLPQETSGLDFTAVTACTDIILNGGFEADNAWDFPATEATASYTTAAAHSGTRSARIGIINPANNKYSFSSARQLISVPADTTSATLRLWLYPVSGEAAAEATARQTASANFQTAANSNDAQYVLVLDQFNNWIDTLLWTRSNLQQWTFYEFNLTKYAGKTIKIHIGAFNDGLNGVTGLYADDVVVEACNGGTTPTPPPTPVCGNQLGNSGFEFDGVWGIPVTPFPAGYISGLAHSGSRAMRTGILNPASNIYSYSDAYQSVTIPSTASSATLSLWYYPQSTETTTFREAQPALGEALDRDALAGDTQYLLILDRFDNIVDVLLWQRSDSRQWTYAEFDLLKYAGQTIRIQFGTYNNGYGGVTAMLVDDMMLDTCPGTAPTPTPTPIPGTCQEKILNGSFEVNDDWVIPVTAFSAGYSDAQAHTGARSMRTGIVFTAHNRFSYSDARQTVTIPAGSSSATLGLWMYPITAEPTSGITRQRPTSELLASSASGHDVQYVLILDRYGNWIDTLVWQRSNAQAWTYQEFDLSVYTGATISIQFGTYNDGLDGITTMYMDDVSLNACP